MKQTNLPALQAAVFDMDGTLLDSMQMWAEAPGVLLGRYGVHPPEGFIRRLIPLSARQCAVLMVEEYHLPVTPEQLAGQTAEDGDPRWERLRRGLRLARREELTPRQRQVLALCYDRGLSVTEAARELGVCPSTVSRTLQRARHRLYRCLRYGI